jgi:hypothetical protein
MAIEFAVLKKKEVESLESFRRADAIAAELRQYLNLVETQHQIRERHVLGSPIQPPVPSFRSTAPRTPANRDWRYREHMSPKHRAMGGRGT